MKAVNEYRALGRVGQDVSLQAARGQNGGDYCRFTVALNDEWTDDAGVKHQKTVWAPCIAFDGGKRKLASLIAKYVNKGDLVYVSGRVETYPLEVTAEGKTFSVDRWQVRVLDVTFIPTGNKSQDR